MEGILILMAGAVLLTPGLLTDLVGFLLLVPPVRRAVRSSVLRRLGRRFVASTMGGIDPTRPVDVTDDRSLETLQAEIEAGAAVVVTGPADEAGRVPLAVTEAR